MVLILGEAPCELVEIGDASPPQKVDKLSVSLPRFPDLAEIVSLLPRDAAAVSQIRDKRIVAVDQLDQVSPGVVQPPHPGLVQG